MKIIFNFLTFLLLMSVFSGCGGEKMLHEETAQPSITGRSFLAAAPDLREQSENTVLLDEIAELERSGSWIQGMALTESGIRENAGDYAGAIAAAFKELTWAYGRGLIQKQEVEQGLFNLLSAVNEENVIFAANAMLAFLRENWDEAEAGLESLFKESAFDEPDGFGRWMILVCALEKNKNASSAENRRTGAAYKSIRARYAQFPEYWYRGARAFSGSIAAGFAENCINSSAQGPFSEECRIILASHTGLKTEDGASIKTKTEIETIITQSINSGNPQSLDSLMPLISLADNPYTVYAVGALRALNSIPVFRDYFSAQVSSAKGRLAERLSYICRS